MPDLINLDHAPMVVIDLYQHLQPIQIMEEAQAFVILTRRRMKPWKAKSLLRQLYGEGVFRRYEYNGKKYIYLNDFYINPVAISERQYLITALWIKLTYAPTCDAPLLRDGRYPTRAYFFHKNTIYGIILPEEGETNIALLLDDQAVEDEGFTEKRAYIVVVKSKEMLNQIRIPQTPRLRCDFALFEYREHQTPVITIFKRSEAKDE